METQAVKFRPAAIGRARAVLGDPTTRELLEIALEGAVPFRAFPPLRTNLLNRDPAADLAAEIALDCVPTFKRLEGVRMLQQLLDAEERALLEGEPELERARRLAGGAS